MYYVGVDLGGTKIAVGIVSIYGKLLYKNIVKTEADKGVKTVIDNIIGCINGALDSYGISISNVSSVGIGSPGVIDSESGTVIAAFNFKDMKNICLAEEISKRIHKNVFISNDANCAALGEVTSGAAKGYQNAVMVTLGTGVGGGLILNGKLYEGGGSKGAELGHIVVNHNGRQCTCGRKGCWETYAAASALVKATKEAAEKFPDSILAKKVNESTTINGKTIFSAINDGCDIAKGVLDEYVCYVAEGLIDITNIFRPEIILIGGGISNEGEALIGPIRSYVEKNSYGAGLIDVPKIERATLGNDAGIIGAAMVAKLNTIK